MALCRCDKDTATAVAWPPLDQGGLISVKNIRGAVQKKEAPQKPRKEDDDCDTCVFVCVHVCVCVCVFV